MAKIVFEYQTKYDIGDVVLFHNVSKPNHVFVGVIKRFRLDCDVFWYDIQYAKDKVYEYGYLGDIREGDIICKVENQDECDRIRNIICGQEEEPEKIFWCEHQDEDEDGVFCMAHLFEGRALNCPYQDLEDCLKAEFPCSDYKPFQADGLCDGR